MAKDDDKAKLSKLIKLVAAGQDLVDKLAAIVKEADAVLGGQQTIAQKVKQLETTFEAAWAARYVGRTYVWNYSRDVGHWKRLVAKLGVADLEDRIQVYLHADDPHIVDAKHSFPMFVATVNSHIAAPLLPEGDGVFPVVDCKHKPRCKTEVEHTRKRRDELQAV